MGSEAGNFNKAGTRHVTEISVEKKTKIGEGMPKQTLHTTLEDTTPH